MMTIDEAIKHCKEVVKINGTCGECTKEHEQLAKWLAELKELREKTLKWIPVTYHESTDKEREWFKDVEYILDCPLPDYGQEIIISCDGQVSTDVCGWDGNGCYLEGTDDWLNVDAWMPLPEPYKKED